MKTTAKHFRGESGQSIMELALTLPMLLLILVGVAEFGRFAYASIEVNNAARAGVQYGAQSQFTASDVAGMKLAATQDGPDFTQMSATAKNFCSCADGSASTCAIGDCSASHVVEYVQVNTTAIVNPIFSYPGISNTLTLRGQAIMRVEQ